MDRLLGELPRRLYIQAAPLRYDLPLRWSDSGRIEDVLTQPQHFPLLSLASWLLQDLGVSDGPERNALERRLFLAGVFWLASSHVLDAVHDEASFYDREELALARVLIEMATSQLAPTVPRTFWETYGSFWREQIECELRLQDPMSTDDPSSLEVMGGTAPWAAPARAIAAAAAYQAEREDLLPRLFDLVDSLAKVARVRADLSTLHKDLERGRITYPIATIAHEAGLALERPLPVTELLGALVLSGALTRITDETNARLRVCRDIADELRLTTFASYLEEVDLAVPDYGSPGFSAGGRAFEHSGRLQLRYDSAVPKALDMAERFLLAEPTFRESWEMHREGLFGVPEVASRFPAGLIIELLRANGLATRAQVDDFVEAALRDGLHYYAHPDCDIDSDTLGLVLRLRGDAGRDVHVQPLIARALHCIDGIVLRTGQVPVWITGCEQKLDPALVRLGGGCGTVEAHFLLGLIGFAFDSHRATVERASTHLLDRVVKTGLGANVNYPPLYALGVLLRLTAALTGRHIGTQLRTRNEASRACLLDQVTRFSTSAALSPQDAALLISASFHAGKPEIARERWVHIILKAQGSDGRWPAEPFFPSPTRGRSVTWYSSTTLTTALCYDALAKWAQATVRG